MPRLIFEKPESPERISRHLRSTPVEIPKRRRPVSPHRSSRGHTESPDMIFDMSPTSPTFQPRRKHSVSPHSDKDDEPFMYHAPPFRPYPLENATQPPSKRSGQYAMPLRNSNAAQAPAQLRPPHPTKHSPLHRPDKPLSSTSSSITIGSTLTSTTTKITGFVPLIEHQHLVSDEPRKPVQTLTPPPRRPSFSSSPWILPGRGRSHEMDACYSQADPSALEFREHLLRRMDSRDASRLKTLRTCL